MSKIEGQCLCGQVTYTSSAEPLATIVCHCRNCQRQAGAAFSVNVVVPTESLSTNGNLKTFTDSAASGNTVDRQFCPDCGSPIYSKPSANPAITVVKAGTLNDTSSLAPGAQLWCDSKQNWVDLGDSMQRFAQNFPG